MAHPEEAVLWRNRGRRGRYDAIGDATGLTSFDEEQIINQVVCVDVLHHLADGLNIVQPCVLLRLGLERRGGNDVAIASFQ